MILYDPKINWNLADYGIGIPLRDDRADKAFKYAQKKLPKKYFLKVNPDIAKLTKEDLLLAHNLEFVNSLLGDGYEQEIIKTFELFDELGSYNRYSPAQKSFKKLVDGFIKMSGVSYQAMYEALKNGFTYFLGGGLHHAMSFGGRGFCLINDIVIAIRKLQKEGKIKTAWVIDVDAHKGDGTAELTACDASISTLSIHMANGWPLMGPKYDSAGNLLPWFIPSTVDIPVEEGRDKEYIELLSKGLEKLKYKSKKLPDLAVIVNGADPYYKDELPSAALLNLTLKQLLKRDTLIYNWLEKLHLPQVYLMAGGYGPHSWQVYGQFLHWSHKI